MGPWGGVGEEFATRPLMFSGGSSIEIFVGDAKLHDFESWRGSNLRFRSFPQKQPLGGPHCRLEWFWGSGGAGIHFIFRDIRRHPGLHLTSHLAYRTVVVEGFSWPLLGKGCPCARKRTQDHASWATTLLILCTFYGTCPRAWSG